ncbi:putative AP-1-like transcription factor [Glarea lozoyensis 74030]|uniref:Putative AP-1-like transcription factor n=1 Tax=Glarea lozoyensis (strain ATCC 74030 / MF5533) TaxID=1104152 RepID=H0ER45_GLAL7|nr:putative AP-1-like transcription factor [Glarea lozoyensis 74030]
MAPTAFSESPVQAPASGTLGGLDDSPFIDYEQDFEFDADGSYDYGFDNGSQGQMIGKLPGTSSDGEADSHDKRSHPDDEEEDEDGGGKRREGDEKSSKKPGRKPLTSEPTTKRKAQNRAAQRAFRERKEKHLKDLETKVEDLQKASESANHENSILRAQIEKMSTELKEYKKRLSVGAGVARSSSLNSKYPAYLSGQGLGGGLNNPNDVNFSFEFPKFGRLPGPPLAGVKWGWQCELTFCDKLNMACGNPNNPIPRTMSETSTTSGIQEAQTPAFDINGIDWFAQQNDNQFDPQLFNDYREPQDNILSTDVFGDNSFFGDAYTMPDFSTPYNVEASPIAPKKDLVQQIDEQQNADEEVVPADDRSKMLSCNTIWDRLQACPKVKEGDFDLDNLCKDLQKKAKCSETGAVVDESDFQKIMKSYVDNDNTKKATR